MKDRTLSIIVILLSIVIAFCIVGIVLYNVLSKDKDNNNTTVTPPVAEEQVLPTILMTSNSVANIDFGLVEKCFLVKFSPEDYNELYILNNYHIDMVIKYDNQMYYTQKIEDYAVRDGQGNMTVAYTLPSVLYEDIQDVRYFDLTMYVKQSKYVNGIQYYDIINQATRNFSIRLNNEDILCDCVSIMLYGGPATAVGTDLGIITEIDDTGMSAPIPSMNYDVYFSDYLDYVTTNDTYIIIDIFADGKYKANSLGMIKQSDGTWSELEHRASSYLSAWGDNIIKITIRIGYTENGFAIDRIIYNFEVAVDLTDTQIMKFVFYNEN